MMELSQHQTEIDMNVTTSLIERIEDYRATNKKPCKSYASEAKAESVAKELSAKYAEHFAKSRGGNAPCRYIVAFNEAWGRWIVGFDFSELLGRNTSTGGYLGIASADGFFTY
jgi:predicted ATPase